MSPIEICAVALGLINVFLIIRRSVWNYPFGFAMVALYAWIFYGAKLYSDTLLQIFFFVVQIYGWGNWLSHREAGGRIVPVFLDNLERAGVLVLTAAGSALLGLAMARWTDAALPYWDATIAGLSVAAQTLLSFRRFENWLAWIAADIIAVGVYWYKDLQLTSGLYGVFLAMSLAGLASWWRAAPRPARAAAG